MKPSNERIFTLLDKKTVRLVQVALIGIGLFLLLSFPQTYIGPTEVLRALALVLAKACSFKSARSPLTERVDWTCLNLARLRAAISSASSICFLYDLIFPWSCSIPMYSALIPLP